MIDGGVRGEIGVDDQRGFAEESDEEARGLPQFAADGFVEEAFDEGDAALPEGEFGDGDGGVGIERFAEEAGADGDDEDHAAEEASDGESEKCSRGEREHAEEDKLDIDHEHGAEEVALERANGEDQFHADAGREGDGCGEGSGGVSMVEDFEGQFEVAVAIDESKGYVYGEDGILGDDDGIGVFHTVDPEPESNQFIGREGRGAGLESELNVFVGEFLGLVAHAAEPEDG